MFNVPKLRFREFEGEWVEKRLGDISVNIMYGMNSSAIKYDGLHKYIRITDIDESSRNFLPTPLTSPSGKIDDKYKLVEKDILFARTGASVGKSYMYKIEDGNLYFAGFLIKFHIDNAVPYFIFTCTLQDRYNEWVSIMSVRSGQPGINAEEYKLLKLNLPQKPEQQKIANFLTSIDQKIEQLTKKEKLLVAYKKGVMQKIFSQYDDSELRTARLKDFGYFYYGKSAPKHSLSETATTPCVRYGELYNKYGAYIDKIHSYTTIDRKNLKFSKGGEVLVPRVGEDPLDFANCSYLPIADVAIGEMISVYNTEENGLFMTYYINAMLKYEFAKVVEGGNVSNLYFKYLENIIIKIPQIEEQTKIANFLSSIDKKIEQVNRQIEESKGFKKGLLQEMFV